LMWPCCVSSLDCILGSATSSLVFLNRCPRPSVFKATARNSPAIFPLSCSDTVVFELISKHSPSKRSQRKEAKEKEDQKPRHQRVQAKKPRSPLSQQSMRAKLISMTWRRISLTTT